jgi:hypothetical protein
MKQDHGNAAQQFNLATEQRNAARDYFEFASQGSVEFALTTWSPEQLDKTAKVNSEFFKRRYGFEATTPVRAMVIEFQRKYDLLDRNIWWLRRAGHLRTTRTDLTVDTGLFMSVIGWVQMVLMGLLFGLMFLQIYVSKAPEWKQLLGFILVGAIWLGVIAVIVKLYIEPFRTLKQCGAVADNRRVKRAPRGAEH